jgi:hypothetical protein
VCDGKLLAAANLLLTPASDASANALIVQQQSTVRVVRAHPYVAVVSFLTMAIVLVAGVVGVLAASDTETRHRRDSAKGKTWAA